ncbi:BamA/TamA family outer membrane protein [Chitinophaga lutea]
MVATRFFTLLAIVALLWHSADAQKRPRPSTRDSLDGAFDLSDWIIDAHGFVPIPVPITEPAIGYGGAIMPVLITPRKTPAEYGKKKKKLAPSAPEITGAMAMYTSNKSWAAGAGRTGVINRWGLRYSIMAAYTDINMRYYKTIQGEDHQFNFNIRTIPAFLRLKKRLGYSNWHAGFQYLFTKTEAKLQDPPRLIDSLFHHGDFDNISSMPGLLMEYDSRDNTFTPNKGLKAHVNGNWSNSIFGSDNDYVHLNGFSYAYIPFSKKWISGFRFDMQQVFGDIPFYFKPSIDLRGVPKGRYQGDTNMLVETEQRWNMFRRWSGVFFGGTGKAFDSFKDFGSSKWVYNYGVGARYMLARKLGIYMGADVARGPEQFAYYIQFGNAWLK